MEGTKEPRERVSDEEADKLLTLLGFLQWEHAPRLLQLIIQLRSERRVAETQLREALKEIATSQQPGTQKE